MEKHRRTRVGCFVASFIPAFVLLYIFYALSGFEPFGTYSLNYRDGDIQYIEFLQYWRRCLEGDANIFYSFGKSLGGSMYPVYAYYLTNPIFLLSVFWKAEEMPAFYNFAVALSLALSAANFSVFVTGRTKINMPKKILATIFLSCCYAFSQYGISQGCNCFWLPGLFMLPLIALGIYKLKEGKRFLLSVSVAILILLNWYIGAIACLYTVVILLIEMFCDKTEKLKLAVNYVISMAAGILAGAVVVIPSYFAVGSHGDMGLEDLFSLTFIGNPLSVITNYQAGAVSDPGVPCVYTGTLLLMGFFAFLFSKKNSIRARVTIGLALVFSALTFVFTPLVSVYCLLRPAEFPYGYRYAFCTIFLIAAVGALWFCSGHAKRGKWLYLICGIAMSAVICFYSESLTVYKIVLVLLTSVFLALACVTDTNRFLKNSFTAFAGIFAALELFVAMSQTLYYYHKDNGDSYREYFTEQQSQIEELENTDTGVYRISQTSWREELYYPGATVYFNDSLAYGYNGITSYTSIQEDNSGTFMQMMGYRYAMGTKTVVSSPLIATDSLLGVKYYLSGYDIPGMEKTDLPEHNGKSVYANPYALPLAFFCEDTNEIEYNGNSFDYCNSVYSELLGEDANLFVELDYTTSVVDEEIVYEAQKPSGNYAIYCDIPYDEELKETLDVNGKYDLGYANWMSPTVFYVPSGEDESSVYVKVSGKAPGYEPLFYALDLDALETVTQKLSEGSENIKLTDFAGGNVSAEINCDTDEKVILTIPSSDGWTVELNGAEISPEIFADVFYIIDVPAGENVLTMTYKTPYLTTSLIVSCLGIAGITVLFVLDRRRTTDAL